MAGDDNKNAIVNIIDDQSENERELEHIRAMAAGFAAKLIEPDDIWGISDVILTLKSSLVKAEEYKRLKRSLRESEIKLASLPH